MALIYACAAVAGCRCLTLGRLGLVIDVALIYACAYLADGFQISGPLYALLTALLINTVAAVTGGR